MNVELLEHEMANVFAFAMAVTVSGFALLYTLLAGKQYGKTAELRKLAFRCVAATLMRPNLGFRVGVAFVAISFAFVAYYRANGESSPEPVKIMVSVGMFLTVVASAGLAVARMVRSKWRHFADHSVAPAVAPEVPLTLGG